MEPVPVPIAAARAYDLTVDKYRLVRHVWRLETNRGIYGLKPALPAPRNEILRQAEVHLLMRGFSRFAMPVKTIDGCWECVLPHGGRFILRHWLPGIPPRLELAHRREVAATASVLAELHEAGRDWRPPQQDSWGDWLRRARMMLADLHAFSVSGVDNGFTRAYRRALPEATADGENALAMAADAGYAELAAETLSRGGFCHGDPAANNTLLHIEKAYLLDFDRFEYNMPLHDLVRLLRRILQDQEWLPELAELILASYIKVRSLSARELKVITALLHWPQTFWRVGRQYYHERLPRSGRFFQERLWRWTGRTAQRRAFLHWMRDKYL